MKSFEIREKSHPKAYSNGKPPKLNPENPPNIFLLYFISYNNNLYNLLCLYALN